MENLPLELNLQVLSTMSVEDFLNLCATSKQFENLCNNDMVWSLFLKRDFGITKSSFPKCDYIMRYKFRNMKTYVFTNVNSRDREEFGKGYALSCNQDIESAERAIYNRYMNKTLPNFLMKAINDLLFPRYPNKDELEEERINEDLEEGFILPEGASVAWSTVFSFVLDEELAADIDINLTVQPFGVDI